MDKKNQKFDIIRFTAVEKQYYPASLKWENWMPDTYVKHTDIHIPLGHSRYGGCVIDMPKGIEKPKEFRFAAQLDMTKFSPFDKLGLLPKTGQLLFFADIINDTGKVIYANVPNHELIRIIDEHTDHFFLGTLIDQIFSETETFQERMRKTDNGLEWAYFAGDEKSKLFGIYTNCQYNQERIEEITFSNKTLLLQVGEQGFNDEGVFSVLIPTDDLINLNFDNCEFGWGQS